MFHWIPATLLAVVAWGAVSLYLWLVRRRANETAAGLDMLVGMHWRDFSLLVARALQAQRGLAPIDANDHSAPRGEFLMQQGGQPCLVSCKHGRAYRIGSAAVNELGAAARLAGARNAILVTEGQVQQDGIEAAARQSIEILDGRRLWPLVKPYLAQANRERIVSGARRRAARHTGIAALGALALGLLSSLGLSLLAGPTSPAADTEPARAAAARPQASAAPAPSSAAAPAPAAAGTAGDDDAALLEQQHAVSRALAQTPGIIRGIWLTKMTLAVDREADDDEAWRLICQQVERHPSLRTIRVQLNPRPDRQESVRWRQCSTI